MTPTQADRLNARIDIIQGIIERLAVRTAQLDDLIGFMATHVRVVAPTSILDTTATPRSERIIDAYQRYHADPTADDGVRGRSPGVPGLVGEALDTDRAPDQGGH